jgi:GxxExxY protein
MYFRNRFDMLLANLWKTSLLKNRLTRSSALALKFIRKKGCGFLEAVYQECLEIELELQGVPFVARVPLRLEYKGRLLRQTYEPDLICNTGIVVELKAVSDLADEHRAQVINYLHATRHEVGLLVNFGHYPKIEFERLANTRKC